jgi:hypothetical protein
VSTASADPNPADEESNLTRIGAHSGIVRRDSVGQRHGQGQSSGDRRHDRQDDGVRFVRLEDDALARVADARVTRWRGTPVGRNAVASSVIVIGFCVIALRSTQLNEANLLSVQRPLGSANENGPGRPRRVSLGRDGRIHVQPSRHVVVSERSPLYFFDIPKTAGFQSVTSIAFS